MTPIDHSNGKHRYYNILSSIMLLYNVDVQDPSFDRKMRSYLTMEPINKNIQHQQPGLMNNIDLNTHNIQNLSTKYGSISRNSQNHQNNANQNYVVDNNFNNDVSVSDGFGDGHNNNDNCCTCRIM